MSRREQLIKETYQDIPRMFEIWMGPLSSMEGYSPEHLVETVLARSFPEACDKSRLNRTITEDGDPYKGINLYDPEKVSYWGLALYYNREYFLN